MTALPDLIETKSRARGRPRSFDEAETLKTIRACFAEKGYAGTSICDLSDATGLSTPSLYNAFGDKRTMFLRALDLEFEEVAARLRSVRGDVPSERIREFVTAASTGYASENGVPGITLGAALAEVTSDPEVGRRLHRLIAELDLAAADTLGTEAGSTAAMVLSTLAMGLCLRKRTGAAPRFDAPALTRLLAQADGKRRHSPV
jgi:AcrR family transcriptional regulator